MNKKYLSLFLSLSLSSGVYQLASKQEPKLQKKPLSHKNALVKPINKSVSSYQNPDKIVSISIPKCGTHLLIKCLALFNLPGIDYNYTQEIVPSPEHLRFIRETNR